MTCRRCFVKHCLKCFNNWALEITKEKVIGKQKAKVYRYKLLNEMAEWLQDNGRGTM